MEYNSDAFTYLLPVDFGDVAAEMERKRREKEDARQKQHPGGERPALGFPPGCAMRGYCSKPDFAKESDPV